MSDIDNPSVHEQNKLLRVLNGIKLKYTVRVTLPDDKVLEWQSDAAPSLKFFDEDRSLWLFNTANYSSTPIMRWVEGSVMLLEENKL